MNTTARHTPGPWTAPSAGIYAGTVMVASVGDRSVTAAMRKAGRLHEQHHNARRIAACVNACEGLDDAQLAHLRALATIHNELRAAAAAVVDAWESGDLAGAVRELAAELETFQPVPAADEPAPVYVVHVRGGMVSGVSCDREPEAVRILVCDWDNLDTELDEAPPAVWEEEAAIEPEHVAGALHVLEIEA